MRIWLWVLAMGLLLSGCGPAGTAEEPVPQTLDEQEEVRISPEEGACVLEELLGSEDAATGNQMSYAYEGTLTLESVTYYNYRVSWLVEGHLSYLTNYLVSLDGLTVLEAPDPLAEPAL